MYTYLFENKEESVTFLLSHHPYTFSLLDNMLNHGGHPLTDDKTILLYLKPPQ